jgi:hypothetical protein
MSDKPYLQKNKQERAVEDAFYGGACAVLSLIDYGGSGTASEYLDAVSVLGAERLLAFSLRALLATAKAGMENKVCGQRSTVSSWPCGLEAGHSGNHQNGFAVWPR